MLESFQRNDYSFDSIQQMNDNLVYINYIDANYEYDIVTVSPDDAYRYQGNLFGLFKEMGLSPSLFLYALYLNGYTNPIDFDGKQTVFKKPIKPPIPTN